VTETKKASEVIVEINEKIDMLLSFFKNHDNNQKLIISRLDKIYKKLNLSNNESSNLSLDDEVSKSDINFAKVDFIEVKENLKVDSDKKILVHQFVKYPKNNDKQLPVILAKVKIYPEPGIKDNPSIAEIASIVTNSNGMWEAELLPGKYFAHILKPKTNTKPQIDIYFDFTVDGNEKIKELPKIN
jgi:hypothetical protein